MSFPFTQAFKYNSKDHIYKVLYSSIEYGKNISSTKLEPVSISITGSYITIYCNDKLLKKNKLNSKYSISPSSISILNGKFTTSTTITVNEKSYIILKGGIMYATD